MLGITPLPLILKLYLTVDPEFAFELSRKYPKFFQPFFLKNMMINGKQYPYIFKDKKKKILIPQRKLKSDIKENYLEILGIINNKEDCWQQIYKNESLELTCLKDKGIKNMVIRGKAILKNITIEQAYSHIYDIELRKSWDLIFAEFRKIKQIDSNTDIIYTYIKSPFPFISGRDFVQKRHYLKNFPNKDQIFLQYKSVEIEECPEIKNIIRADTIISGYLLTKLNETDCILDLVSTVDIKGQIPKPIVNMIAQRAPIKWIDNLKKKCMGVEIDKKNGFM